MDMRNGCLPDTNAAQDVPHPVLLQCPCGSQCCDPSVNTSRTGRRRVYLLHFCDMVTNREMDHGLARSVEPLHTARN